MKDWGNRLRHFARNDYGRLIAFADASEIISSQLSKYISEANFPSLAILSRWYDLGMSIDWLISGQGAMRVDAESPVVELPTPSLIPESTIETLEQVKQTLIDALLLIEQQIKEGK